MVTKFFGGRTIFNSPTSLINDEIYIKLSNIPFKFKLSPQDLFAWACITHMSNEITKEIDAEIIKVLTQQYK